MSGQSCGVREAWSESACPLALLLQVAKEAGGQSRPAPQRPSTVALAGVEKEQGYGCYSKARRERVGR